MNHSGLKMSEYMQVNDEKIMRISEIKRQLIQGEIGVEEAKTRAHASFEMITPQEFAICEQHLQAYGITDDQLAENMDDIVSVFEDLLQKQELQLEPWHPIQTYMNEVGAIRSVLAKMQALLSKKIIKNQWLEVYDQLNEIKTHFARKQNQLFPALEKKGFDKPSKVMWTLDNQVKDAISKGLLLLEGDKNDVFLQHQVELIQLIEDLLMKEEDILFPTALELIREDEFVHMRQGDDEIGYCLIDPPAQASAHALPKQQAIEEHHVLRVSQGSLTLEQINLIYKHLPVDLSYVDEKDIVRFYSDTKHRVFPRSPGVIGREVRHCHPRESVATVEEIIRAFKTGEQDQAEFWLELGGRFIYIIYNAVRDEKGVFKGVLEMMQDVTRIRELSGSQRLLSWQKEGPPQKEAHIEGLSKDTIIGDLIKQYPFVKDYLLELSPKFSKLKNPILFQTMSRIATIEMICERGNLNTDELLSNLQQRIQNTLVNDVD